MNPHYDAYLQECRYVKRLSKETIRGYLLVFSRFSRVMPEVDSPSMLSVACIAEFFKRIEMSHTGPAEIRKSTLRTYWNKLFTLYEWLTLRGVIQENPMRKMQPPQPEVSHCGELSKEDLQRILSAIMLYPGNTLALKRNVAMFYTLVFCGLRKRELLGLQIADINFEKQFVTVRSVTSKSRKSRMLPLHPTLRYHLKEYLEERKKRGFVAPALWIHCRRDMAFTIDGLKHWTKRLIRLSKIKLHLHQFRHSFACSLARQNVNAVKIQKLLGHADVSMTMTYLRSLTPEDLREDVERLSLL